MKKNLLLTLAFVATSAIFAQVPTWSNDIAPIFYKHCCECHNPQGIAPESFIYYSDVFAKRTEIKQAVVTRYMPPWLPDPEYRHFGHERILSSAQIKSIVDWVNAGAPCGDMAEAPTKPAFTRTALITDPDWTGKIPSYTVKDTADLYRCFVIPSGLMTDKYITELEVIPGDRSMVHHVAVYEDTTSTPLQLDERDPGPGYTDFSGTGSSASAIIGGWAPGYSPVYKLPLGMGILLHAHANIILQIHYPKGARNKTDSTRLNVKLSDAQLRKVSFAAFLIDSALDNGPLFIPANTVKKFDAHYTFQSDYTLLAMAAHMHLIGHSVSSWAVSKEGKTIPLLSIPHWDFHWQSWFDFPKLQKISAGTVIYSSTVYDNTINNHDNPNHPPKDVSQGGKTTDEMMWVAFAYTPYQAGDENIVQDSSILNSIFNVDNMRATSLYDPYLDTPGNSLKIEFYLSKNDSISISLMDESGKFTSDIIKGKKEFPEGLHSLQFNMRSIKPGIYFIKMQTTTETFIRNLVKK